MAAFAPEIITQIGPLQVTNTFLHTLIVDGVLIATAFFAGRNLKKIPQGFQSFTEAIVDAMYSLTESIASSKKAAMSIFPYVMTFFLFILFSNLLGLFPGVGTIGFYEEGSEHSRIVNEAHASEPIHNKETVTETHSEAKKMNQEASTTTNSHEKESGHTEEIEQKAHLTPLLRGATSDINVTLALALISVVATHMLSIQLTGLGDYLGRFFSFNPINLYVGLLELVAEVTKIISLSFRLFGNIFAGEIALHTISNIFAFLAPLPFLLLESIVSIVQALVFSVLTLVFMAVLTTPHHAHAKEENH